MRNLFVLAVLLAACDDETKPTPTDSGDEEQELEGDDAGECRDGADNDVDGLFDCDDPDCEGSPDCETTPIPTTTGDTADSTGCASTYSGPILVQEVSVSCDGSDNVRYEARTDGWTSNGLVNAMDTANNSPWDDEHDLVSYEYDDCGFEDNLEQVLTTGASLATWAANQSTLYRCDDHFEAPTPVMTYAVRVYDLDGNFADCLAFGHDPGGFANGDYWATCINCPSNPGELSSCLVARSAL